MLRLMQTDTKGNTYGKFIHQLDAGAKLTLTAQTTLGSGCTYKFIIFNPATNQWFKLQDFSSSNTFTWTAGSDGTRLVLCRC